MSQPAGTGTSAGAVRSGMATAVAAAAPTASSATAAAAAATPTTTEYRLRAASRALPRHHIAKLSVPRFSIAECVEPVHLYRGAVVNTINQFHVEQAAAAAAAAAGGPHAMAVDGPVADVRLGPDGKPETTGQRLEREREAIAQEIAP